MPSQSIIVDNNALEVPEARKVMIVSMAWSHLGMSGCSAGFSPARFARNRDLRGPVTIDNPISVMDSHRHSRKSTTALITAYNDAETEPTWPAPPDSFRATRHRHSSSQQIFDSVQPQILSENCSTATNFKAVDDNQYLARTRTSSRCRTGPSASTRSVMYVPVITFSRDEKARG